MPIHKKPAGGRGLKTWAVTGVAIFLGLSVSGCGAIDDFNKVTADAWAVTYEVTVTGGDTGSLNDIEYLESLERGDDPVLLSVDTGVTTKARDGHDAALWSVESIVTAQMNAAVAATPGDGATATCRILLDGVQQIAEESAAPGERVECAALTPGFPK